MPPVRRCSTERPEIRVTVRDPDAIGRAGNVVVPSPPLSEEDQLRSRSDTPDEPDARSRNRRISALHWRRTFAAAQRTRRRRRPARRDDLLVVQRRHGPRRLDCPSPDWRRRRSACASSDRTMVARALPSDPVSCSVGLKGSGLGRKYGLERKRLDRGITVSWGVRHCLVVADRLAVPGGGPLRRAATLVSPSEQRATVVLPPAVTGGISSTARVLFQRIVACRCERLDGRREVRSGLRPRHRHRRRGVRTGSSHLSAESGYLERVRRRARRTYLEDLRRTSCASPAAIIAETSLIDRLRVDDLDASRAVRGSCLEGACDGRKAA
jgi:hypothetical protein